ncbi:Putative phytase [Wenzhouxiangella marina]|uniref:Putative phytase n=2 Tax=Wenzhouxiangella marina TaxID=1579979 RepID=A0A0K0XUV2_9GAMM|nr:Putative phytase [Wenzhouxiangella marina]
MATMMRTSGFGVLSLLALALLAACGEQGRDAAPSPSSAPAPLVETAPTPRPATEVAERWLTQRDEGDNVDSVAVWSDGVERNWLLATAKESDILIIYDAATGERLGEAGGTGNAPGRLLRPNGLFVIDDLVWIVERDNHRLQALSLPDFAPLGIFGADVLVKPYGLWMERADTGYRIFVTDSYETVDEQVPPDAELDGRLHRFDIVDRDGRFELVEHRRLGPTEGVGRLFKVESLWGDPANDRLLVADEHPDALNLKIFDLEGRFTGETALDGELFYEPEGTALDACEDGRGFWVVTDQDHLDNRFLVLDRLGLDVLGAFTGAVTANTDGVWLHPAPLPGFPGGAFYAVHDDGNVGAFDWAEVQSALNLTPCTQDVMQ